MYEEFHLTIPPEAKGIILSLGMIVAGLVTPPLIDLLLGYSLSAIMVLLLQLMTPVGVMLLIVFGLSTLIAGESIFRFLPLKRVLVSSQGITLYNRTEHVSRVIGWHEIEQIKFGGKKYMFLGLAEVGRQLVSIELRLVDGSNFKIPVDSVLKAPDRSRMASTISRYAAALNPSALR